MKVISSLSKCHHHCCHQNPDNHHSSCNDGHYILSKTPLSPQSQYHESYKWAMKAVQLLVPSNPPKVGTYHHAHDVNHHDFDDDVNHDDFDHDVNHDDFDDDVAHDHRFTTGDHRCVTSGQQGLCCQKRVRQSKLLMIVS